MYYCLFSYFRCDCVSAYTLYQTIILFFFFNVFKHYNMVYSHARKQDFLISQSALRTRKMLFYDCEKGDAVEPGGLRDLLTY